MIPTIGPARRTQRRRYPPTPVTPALPLNTGVQSSAAPRRARKAPGAPSRHPSPLRYPGGKARMARTLARIWDGIPLRPCTPDLEVWIEPFAGGAGAALALLEAGVVDEARLIEANPAIAALWRTILDEPDRLAAHVERHTPTTTSFYASRETFAMSDVAVIAIRWLAIEIEAAPAAATPVRRDPVELAAEEILCALETDPAARDLDMDTRVDVALAAAGRLHDTGWLTPPEEAGKR